MSGARSSASAAAVGNGPARVLPGHWEGASFESLPPCTKLEESSGWDPMLEKGEERGDYWSESTSCSQMEVWNSAADSGRRQWRFFTSDMEREGPHYGWVTKIQRPIRTMRIS